MFTVPFLLPPAGSLEAVPALYLQTAESPPESEQRSDGGKLAFLIMLQQKERNNGSAQLSGGKGDPYAGGSPDPGEDEAEGDCDHKLPVQ